MSTNNKVLIAMPCGSGFVPSMMVRSLLELRKPCPCAFLIVDRQQTHKARNYMALQAIEGGFTHLLMVDDDNPIPADTLEKMLEDNVDIVAAPILTRNPNPQTGRHDLCAFYGVPVETSAGTLQFYKNIAEFNDYGPLHRVDVAGTGCMLIRVEVLRAMRERVCDYFFENSRIDFDPIQFEGQEIKIRTMSEDVDFCEKAVQCGFSVYIDDRVRPYHIGAPNLIQYG